MIWSHLEPKKSLVGGWQINLIYSPGPGQELTGTWPAPELDSIIIWIFFYLERLPFLLLLLVVLLVLCFSDWRHLGSRRSSRGWTCHSSWGSWLGRGGGRLVSPAHRRWRERAEQQPGAEPQSTSSLESCWLLMEKITGSQALLECRPGLNVIPVYLAYRENVQGHSQRQSENNGLLLLKYESEELPEQMWSICENMLIYF